MIVDAEMTAPRVSHDVSALKFSDLYLEPGDIAWFKRNARDKQRNVVPVNLLASVTELRSNLSGHPTGFDFRANWEDVEIRVQRLETLDGDVFVCRRLLPRPIAFNVLGYPPRLQEALLSPVFSKGGLLVFAGASSEGKSMSLASWLVARMRKFGGTACTIENPIEIRLQGQYSSDDGKVIGTCYQNPAENDAQFGPLIVRMLRAAPNIMMLGEIRTRDAAAEAILAAASGHLVGITIHAKSVAAALERLHNMVSDSGIDTGMLADALCGIIHQEMDVAVDANGQDKVSLRVSPLIVAGATNETSSRNHVRSGKFTALASEIERQRNISSGLAEMSRF
ncbi:ATPase, T2SS/T4P/T4SS family [Paraburkholderia sp. J8-2]|uniref:ATPase, T2SS/T4P/T4SS family n=1 Tax=Paraburkholderia sp. J8-2 TaxID=2805440 RepID=UPI002AB78941|nr:ATPase, T2SS/T4P/T4SS family [Paraburkholderia sp. J8-2]